MSSKFCLVNSILVRELVWFLTFCHHRNIFRAHNQYTRFMQGFPRDIRGSGRKKKKTIGVEGIWQASIDHDHSLPQTFCIILTNSYIIKNLKWILKKVAMGRCQSTPGLVESKDKTTIEEMWISPQPLPSAALSFVTQHTWALWIAFSWQNN